MENITTAITTALFTFHYGSILIDFLKTATSENLKFTFHYGSILIDLKNLRHKRPNTFTFHYGSILIQMFLIRELGLLNLHSTMVLF